ncbi:isochorismatase family protein [Herbidospora sp. NEAU-GS84]|uniref:Isochorismatase family protein n=1 Tax=Herbidospora solisilvae TaxID=2696284 RepID=A0A7C9N3N6_9ACTN|nr:isochorismatase family protein [Herbidospora solisilvae]NAS24769.1 isochorismatase family protein [Herbidospora solisilvae]
MAIPAIEPYPMPTDLPDNIAPWEVDLRRAALLVHDMQNYFLDPFTDPSALLENVAALKKRFAACGAPVFYTAQPGGMSTEDRGLLMDFWGPGMTTDPAHRAIVPALEPAPQDVVLTKWRPSAFCRTDLLRLLRERGRDQLVICGVYAHVGILMTAHESFSNDIQTFVVADAIADFTPGFHRLALDYAAARCAVTIPTAGVLDALEATC